MLIRNNDDKVEMACPKCNSEDFERIMSCTNHQMGGGSAAKQQASAQTRSCSSGTCTTYEIPGPSS